MLHAPHEDSAHPASDRRRWPDSRAHPGSPGACACMACAPWRCPARGASGARLLHAPPADVLRGEARAHGGREAQLHSQPPCRAHVTLPRRNGVSGGESNTSHLRRRQPRLAHAARSMNPQHSALRRTAATHGMSALTQMLWCIRLFRRCWACKRPHAGRPPCYHAGSGGSRATPGERCGDAALARARRRRGAVLYLPYPNPGRPGARMGPAWARAARLLRSAATVRLECTRDRRWSILTSSPCSCHAVGLG